MTDVFAWRDTTELHECVRRAQAGDDAALEQVVRHFGPLVRKTARFYRNVSFEDAVQEGYAALLVCIHSYRMEMGIPFAGYALAKVRGDVRTAMRRLWTYESRVALRPMGRDASASESWDAFLPATDGDVFGQSLWRLCAEQAGLSPRERLSAEALMQGLTSTDIANRVGVGVETAKTWRKRALRKLRAALVEVR